jgi:hypothetical protein
MRTVYFLLSRQAAKMGWGRFAGTGDKASAGNRVTAGKAAIGARHIAIVAAFQIDFEVLTEWGPAGSTSPGGKPPAPSSYSVPCGLLECEA